MQIESFSAGMMKKLQTMNIVVSITVLAVSAYAVIVLALYLLQPRLIFFPDVPSRSLGPGPGSIGLPYETVNFSTEDGIRLHAWFVPSPEPRGVVLFFHGNAGNISHRLDSLKIFNELGFSTLIFDYRGYGESEGKVTEPGTYRDAEAAWRYLIEQRGFAASQIVLFGRSLGAAVAAHLASRHDPAALIMESGFVSVPELAAKLYPWLPARMLARFRYAAGDYLKTVSCPVLIAHSRDDEIIPYDQALALFEHAAEPKQLLTFRGGHNDGILVSGRNYRDELNSFLTSVFGD